MGRLVNREPRSSVPQPQSVDSLPHRSPPSPSLFSAIPTSRGLFPVPLLPTPARPNSSSRRVRRSHSDRRLMTAMANRAVRAINTLHFNYPSSRYACALSFRSHESDPSPAQRRLQQSLLSASARLVQSCRQLGSVAASSSLTAGQSAATVQLIPGRLDSASTAPRASPLLTALTSYDHSDPSAASLFYTTKDVTPSSPMSSSLPVWGSSSHPTTGSQTSPLTLSRAFDAFDALHTRSAVGPPGGMMLPLALFCSLLIELPFLTASIMWAYCLTCHQQSLLPILLPISCFSLLVRPSRDCQTLIFYPLVCWVTETSTFYW